MVLQVDFSILFCNSPSKRTRYLQEISDDISHFDKKDLGSICQTLVSTYPRYLDYVSRTKVLEIWNNLFEVFPEPMIAAWPKILTIEATKVLKFCRDQNDRYVSTSFERYALLSWTCFFFKTLRKSEKVKPESTTSLLKTIIKLFDSLTDSSYISKGLKNASQREIRYLMKIDSEIVSFLFNNSINTIVDFHDFVFPGFIIKQTSKVEQDLKVTFFEKYANVVLGSKTVVPLYVTESLGEIFKEMSEELFLSKFKATIDRMILRAPEVVLQTLTPLFNSLSFDLSNLFASQLVDQVLSAYQSSSLKTRSDALSLFTQLCSKSYDDTNWVKISEKFLKTMTSKLTSWEHRYNVFESAGTIGKYTKSVSVSSMIVKGMLPIISKETHEQVLQMLMNSFSVHIINLINYSTGQSQASQELIEGASKMLEKGIKQDKPGLRKAFVKALGTISLKVDSLPQCFIETCAPLLSGLLRKIQSSPIGVNNLPLEGFVAAGILENVRLSGNHTDLLEHLKYINFSVHSTSKTVKDVPFFLHDRIITKISEEDEFFWLLKLLLIVVKSFNHLEDSLKSTLTNALMTVLLELSSRTTITMCYEIVKVGKGLNPKEFGSCIIEAIKKIISTHSKLTNNQASRLKKVLKLLFTDCDSSSAIHFALMTLVLSSHSTIAPRDGSFLWVSLVTQAGLEIAELVNSHSISLISTLEKSLKNGPKDIWWSAALESSRLLSFISPETVATKLSNLAIQFLSHNYITNLSPTDVKIWQLPAGMLYKDVLDKNSRIAEDRNRKGADMENWEREIRESLARKNGSTKKPKLLKEEQELYDKQLAEESEIRQKVEDLYVSLQNGILLAQNIIAGLQISSILYDLPPVCELFVSKMLTSLFNVIQREFMRFFLKDKTTAVWLTLGMVLPIDLNDLPMLIAIATLRSHSVKVSPEWQGEPLEELLSRLLFRLQMLSSRKKFSAPAFAYVFPLIQRILLTGGVGFEADSGKAQIQDAGHDDDQPSLQVEQVTLALDVLGKHCGLASNPAMPRESMISTLLHTIYTQPKLCPSALEYLLNLVDSMSQSSDVSQSEIRLLYDGLLSDSVSSRKACLQSLGYLDLQGTPFWANIWIERFAIVGQDQQESELASKLWEENKFTVPSDFSAVICHLLTNDVTHVRSCTASSVYDIIKLHPSCLESLLDELHTLYKKLAEPIKPQYDRFGMLIPGSLEREDPFVKRISVAQALGGLAPHLNKSLIEKFLNIMIEQESLADKHQDVRKAMLQASLVLIQYRGQNFMKTLMPILQSILDQPDKNSITQDYIREAVVILYGTLARNLRSTDSAIPGIIDKLVQTLDQPSESVQFAVAECLPPLIANFINKADELIPTLLDKTINSDKFAKRRGAAFGLAGMVKGKGLTALGEFDIMNTISEAAKSKRSESRQGAMFALETLCELLGRLFEPYIVQILPILLVCFSDNSDDVRRATLATSRVIMSKLSGHGIKVTLPSLLQGLEDYQWRTKRGAIELLGSMAYCAPRQLAISLPTIVPRLVEVLNDSHHQVKGSANSALNSFTDVINNPEIRELMPLVMNALSDPNSQTQIALKALLDTPFMHYLDAPSLALVVPILQRGLKERSTDVKCKASQIVGSMASLTDEQDLIPYLSILLPGLMEILIDPVPAARSTSAKSLGVMVSKMGEINFPDLISELIYILKTNVSSVDRSGAAQGLSEILCGLDISRMEGLLPEILANTQSPKAHVREGFTTLLIYLPATFGLRFKPYLHKVLAPVLNGLADESDYVRDASLRAGQIIITNYSDQAINLLLPELQRGIFEAAWRIRQSSAQLMGDLLFSLMGITAKIELDDNEEEDENAAPIAAEGNRKALLEILGQERRDLVLAGLYLIRSDVSAKVRQVSSAIWKIIVSNTPRTLKEILPVVMHQILEFITSPIPERQYMSAASLADLVRKLGESGLKKILPILHVHLDSEKFEVRQAACVALSEMIGVLGKSDAADFLNVTTMAVLKALCDESNEVRETAAKTFDTLHHHIGPTALETILPSLMDDLKSGNKNNALEALRGLVSVRANAILPSVIPSLVSVPISQFNAEVLGSLIEAGGSAVNSRLKYLLPPLMQSCSQPDSSAVEAVRETIRLLLSQVNDNGVEILMDILLSWVQDPSIDSQIEACATMAVFFQVIQDDIDMLPYAVEWIRTLVPFYKSTSDSLLFNVTQAFSGFIKALDKNDLDQLVSPLRQTVRNTVKALPVGQDLPGFCLPKAISPFLSVYLQGLMFSSSDIRERSANSIGELIVRTDLNALKPFVTQITGPLIRIIGDRYSALVRVAILDTMHILFNRASSAMKPFLPQLQRTFIKSLADAHSADVRQRAASGLEVLTGLLLRIDPLCTELLSGCRASTEDDIRLGFLKVLSNLVSTMSDKLSSASKESIQAYLTEASPEFNAAEKNIAKSIASKL